MKYCTRCKIDKEISKFSKDRSRADGLCNWCKECICAYHKQYHIKNRDLLNAKYREYYKIYPEVRSKYYQKNKKKIIDYNKQYRKKHQERERERRKQYYYDNWDKERKTKNAYYNECTSFNPQHKLSGTIRNRIWYSLKRKKAGRPWELLVGYTLKDLMNHLEKLFKKGMTWANYGQWHVDHKIPISAFNFNVPEDIDFKRCWALENLQPLWAKDNVSKNNRIQFA